MYTLGVRSDGVKMIKFIKDIKGIGPARAKLFARMKLETASDLVQYFPRAYEDRSKIRAIKDISNNEDRPVLVNGTVKSVVELRPRRGMTILKVLISDGTGGLELVWFNQPFKKRLFKVGEDVHAFGKTERAYGRLQMNSPEAEPGPAVPGGLVPVYALTEGLRQADVRRAVAALFADEAAVKNLIPPCLSLDIQGAEVSVETYKALHFPASFEALERARKRLAFEELFALQAGLLLKRRAEQSGQAVKFGPNGKLIKGLLNNLPFSLTKGQTEAFADIVNDTETQVPMQRLVQGDVGSGKTVVAALALAKAVENGYQGALMAPTGILATQHYEELNRLFKDLPVCIALLTGRTTGKERELILQKAAHREVDILVGTHALIQDDVIFSDLALVVTDEQHRFGVRQRAALRNKGKDVHTLFLTATPIPRTMALSVYGDLDVSTMRELPPGRKPVKTYVVTEGMRSRIYAFMRKEIAAGYQCYVVCPLVEESASADLQAATALYESLKSTDFADISCGLVHGRMSGKEKDEVMERFQRGDIKLLVATSVIEVGVNVPNATIMYVDGAERFGLAQLHQLRGRVGRGAAQAYCILLAKSGNEETRQRLKWMETIHDGFSLSEKDLLLRGAGQLFGSMQHGLPDLKAARIIEDADLLIPARDGAQAYLRLPGTEKTVKEALKKRFGNDFLRILDN